MDKSIVLLSGGMDSAVALYWAAKRYEIVSVMNFDYGQHGAQGELNSATMVLGSLKAYGAVEPLHDGRIMVDQHLHILKVRIRIPVRSALTSDLGSLDPDAKDRYGQPMTFVPGRNLIFISYATAVAYDLGARCIIGGWSGIDVDYPDCNPDFLDNIGIAGSLAIGRGLDGLVVRSPLASLTKAETVSLGESLGVQWNLTRSCYAGDDKPCLKCDSCLVRVKAFIAAGVRDPLVADDVDWDALIDRINRHDMAIEGQDEPTSE